MESVSIQGRRVTQKRQDFPIKDVLLDAENPRIQHLVGERFKTKKPSQLELRKMILEQSRVSDLFKSIRDNKGLYEPILIRSDGRVIEGNCRAACYLSLNSTFETEKCWQTIDAYVLPDVTEQEVAILQGHHHVGGKNKWPTYEKAGHVHRMANELKMDVKTIAGILRMKEAKVNDILKSYLVMKNSVLPRISKGGLKKWSYVLEYVEDKTIHAALPVKDFVDLLVGQKITKGADVRKLTAVLANPAATKVLKKTGITQALAVVGKKDPTVNSTAFKRLADMTAFLKDLRDPELSRLKNEKKPQQLLRELFKAVQVVANIAAVKL